MKEKSPEKSEHNFQQRRRIPVGFEKDKNIEKIDSKVLSHRDNYYRVGDSHQPIDIDKALLIEEEQQKALLNKGGNYERQPVYKDVTRELPPQSNSKKAIPSQQRPLLSHRNIDNSKNNLIHHGDPNRLNTRRDAPYQNVKAPYFPGNQGPGNGHLPSVNQAGNVQYPQRGPTINGRQNYDRYEHSQYIYSQRDQNNVQQSHAGKATTDYQPQRRRGTNINKAVRKYVVNAHHHGHAQNFDHTPVRYEGARYIHIEETDAPSNRNPVNHPFSEHDPGLDIRRRDTVNSQKSDPQIDPNRDVQYVMRSKSASRERLMSGKHSNPLPRQPGDIERIMSGKHNNQLPRQPGDRERIMSGRRNNQLPQQSGERERLYSGKQSNRFPQQPVDNRLPRQPGDKKTDAWDKNYLSDKTNSNRQENHDDKNNVNLATQNKINVENKFKEGQSNTEKGYVFPDTDDIEDIDPEDIEEEYIGNEIYLCYLMTESGAIAGPLQLNIDDVQIGLPSQVQFNNDKNNQQKNSETNDEKETEEGMRNRQTGSHGLNETSSRSHSMLTLTIDSEIQDPDDENLYLTKRGKLTFVDLAGSEKVKESNSSAETLIESNNINRSLLVLGNCISSLGDAKKRQGHIPYRDSKLTKLLADSLGGQGVTLMIACVTPSSHHAAESINTLRYASRAKRIRTKPIVKMDPREKLIMSLKREVKALRNENVYLRQQLEFPAKTARPVATQRENEEKLNKIMKDTHKDNVDPQLPKGNTDEAGLYEMLQEYMIENEALRTENSEMHSNKDKVKREQQNLYKENEKLLRRIEDLQREKRAVERRSNPPPQDPYYTSPHQSPIPMGYGRPPPPPQGNGQQWSNQPVQYPADQYSGYNSPNAGNRGKPPPHGVPKRPPHRLPPDPIMRQGHPPPQELIQNGVYTDEGYMSPNGRHPYQNGNRQESPQKVDSRRSSYSSSSDNIRNMNEKLKQELMQLDGEIEHSQVVNYRTRSYYGSQASLRSGPR